MNISPNEQEVFLMNGHRFDLSFLLKFRKLRPHEPLIAFV